MDAETLAAFEMLRQHVDQRSDRVDQRLEGVDRRLEQLHQRLDLVDHRLEVVDHRLDRVDQRLDRVDQRLDRVDQRLDRVDQRFEQVDRRFDEADATALETRREFHVVAESLRGDMRLLAEGFTLRIDRLETTLRDEMVRSHSELATLMRLGYADLGRRVTALERRPQESD